MRVTAEIWVKAYIRRCMAECIPAVVYRRGAREAGAIYIKVSRLDGSAILWGPAPAGLEGVAGDRMWAKCHDGDTLKEADADEYLARQLSFDPDLWIVELEDPEGRAFLDPDVTI